MQFVRDTVLRANLSISLLRILGRPACSGGLRSARARESASRAVLDALRRGFHGVAVPRSHSGSAMPLVLEVENPLASQPRLAGQNIGVACGTMCQWRCCCGDCYVLRA